MNQPPTDQAPRVPREYAGLWIAWKPDLSTIIAAGATPSEALRAASNKGEANPILAKSLAADRRLIGASGQ